MKYLIIAILLVNSWLVNASSNHISLSFDNTDVRLALKSLAKLKQLNLITSDKVVGKVSIEFESVEWRKALSLIMQLNDLGV